jgi:PKD repeat protein
MTSVDIPNYGFGSITGCGYDQGIYVGNFDIYNSSLPGMYMDLTGVCNGDYYIVSITDPDNNFIESDETNNWAATPITLTQQNPLPVGLFTDTVSGGSTVQFINPPSLTYSFHWFFGDGGTSTNQNPIHTYTSNGMYAVTLIVSNNCGGDTVTHFVTITGISVGLGENAITTFGYSIYPNPVEDNTTVSYFIPEKMDVNFELYNMLGEKVYTIEKGTQEQGHYEFNIQLSQIGISNGVYTMQLKTPGKSASIRLVQITK